MNIQNTARIQSRKFINRYQKISKKLWSVFSFIHIKIKTSKILIKNIQVARNVGSNKYDAQFVLFSNMYKLRGWNSIPINIRMKLVFLAIFSFSSSTTLFISII